MTKPTRRQCSAWRNNYGTAWQPVGWRCGNYAVVGSDFCRHHAELEGVVKIKWTVKEPADV